MKANPGGRLAIKDIIGRDKLVEDLWETLSRQSVYMTAERRIGKTHVMNIMCQQPPKGWLSIYQDLEKHHNATDFAISVYQEVQKYLSTKKRVSNQAKKLLLALGGAEVKGVLKLPEKADLPWKQIFEHTIADIVKEQAVEDCNIVFLWDEMPYMLANIATAEGEQVAIEVLDMLRSLRQTYKNFRVLMAGSVGLHHVIGRLKEQGYTNEPLNDMYQFDITTIGKKDAEYLSQQLLQGANLQASDIGAVASMIALQADNFPFYIHHIVREMESEKTQSAKNKVTAEDVERIVLRQLTNENDPWEFRHYETRIKDYYGDRALVVKIILDELALKKKSIGKRVIRKDKTTN